MTDELNEAIRSLLETAYLMGLSAGSGREVFSNGQILTSDELTQQYREQNAELNRLLEKECGGE